MKTKRINFVVVMMKMVMIMMIRTLANASSKGGLNLKHLRKYQK